MDDLRDLDFGCAEGGFGEEAVLDGFYEVWVLNDLFESGIEERSAIIVRLMSAG